MSRAQATREASLRKLQAAPKMLASPPLGGAHYAVEIVAMCNSMRLDVRNRRPVWIDSNDAPSGRCRPTPSVDHKLL